MISNVSGSVNGSQATRKKTIVADGGNTMLKPSTGNAPAIAAKAAAATAVPTSAAQMATAAKDPSAVAKQLMDVLAQRGAQTRNKMDLAQSLSGE